MIEIRKDQIQEYYFRNDYDILKVALGLDFQRLKNDLEEIRQSVPFVSKDAYGDFYTGMGLQYKDESNPLYDAVEIVASILEDGVVRQIRRPKFFAQKNQYGEKLNYVFEALKPLRLFRGRILSAAPGIKMTPHTDGKYVLNAHIPIYSNEQCRFHVENRNYYLEPDGSLYIVNARKLHHVTNQSEQDRLHLIFTINFFSFQTWEKSLVDSVVQEMKLKPHEEAIYKYFSISP